MRRLERESKLYTNWRIKKSNWQNINYWFQDQVVWIRLFVKSCVTKRLEKKIFGKLAIHWKNSRNAHEPFLFHWTDVFYFTWSHIFVPVFNKIKCKAQIAIYAVSRHCDYRNVFVLTAQQRYRADVYTQTSSDTTNEHCFWRNNFGNSCHYIECAF